VTRVSRLPRGVYHAYGTGLAEALRRELLQPPPVRVAAGRRGGPDGPAADVGRTVVPDRLGRHGRSRVVVLRRAVWTARQSSRVRRLLTVLSVFGALAASGCSAVFPDAEKGARHATEDQAAKLTRYLSLRPQDGVHAAVDFARLADDWTDTDVLSAAGDRIDGSLDLLVRITTSGTYSDGFSTSTVSDTGCFRITQVDRYGFKQPKKTDCPANVVALTPPPAPVVAAIPDGYDDRLDTALSRLTGVQRGDPGTVLATARRTLAGAPAEITFAVAGDTVGVAISASRYECVLAAVDPDDTSVWRPARVYLQPGEVGCTAESAAHHALVDAPH
jgi:hypothetical protein